MRKINNKTFTYTPECNSVKYEVIFIQGFPLKSNHLGKSWAKRTECTLRCNGFIVATGFVTKHNKDKDSTLYAFMNAFNIVKKIYL